MTVAPADVAYRARALAQAHPMSALAKRYHDAAVAEERRTQPMVEIGTWAGTAMLTGYCVRRVQEADAGEEVPHRPRELTLHELESLATLAASELRAGVADRFLPAELDSTIEVLERIVASEVERRLDHLRESVDEAAWTELREYLAWWVVKGYALRVAEVSGAVP